MITDPYRVGFALILILGIVAALVREWRRPVRDSFDAIPPRDRRAWVVLGVLIGSAQLVINWGANWLAATIGLGQGAIALSMAMPPRARRVTWTVCGLLLILALSLALLRVDGFVLNPTRTA